MRIQPSFWIKMQRLYAQRIADGCPLGAKLDNLIERIPAASPSEQHALMAELFTRLGALPDAVNLGFAIGEQASVTAYGAASLGILTAPTVNDALGFVADVNHLVLPLIDYSYEESPSYGRFSIGFRCALDSAGEAFAVAICVAMLAKVISRCSGRSSGFGQVELTGSSRGVEAQYRSTLSITPFTDCPRNVLTIERAVLDVTNTNADADTFVHVQRACEEQADLQICHASLLNRVREGIMSAISAPPSQKSLAKALDMSPRQLRVTLSKENTSYQAIIRDCRVDYASTLLRNPSLSLSQIADRLGYSDLSAFSHAFCRWTGDSPSAFRSKLSPRRGVSWPAMAGVPPGTLHYINTGA